MKIPTTINPSFNEAMKYLVKLHPVFFLGSGPALDMRIRPKGLRTDKEWSIYLDAVTTVLRIGERNKWLRLHVDGAGRALFWLVDIPSEEIQNGSRPIWDDGK